MPKRRPHSRAFSRLCPQCGRRRRFTDSSPPWMCASCGAELPRRSTRDGLWDRLAATVLPPEDSPGALVLGGRTLVWMALALWGLHFLAMDPATNAAGRSFLHHVNLTFHEAGHVLFRPFGRFLTVLGGSLFQVLVPLVVAAAFLVRRHPFGVSVGLWWAGQSLIDVAPYIHDARRMTLPLLGGGTGQDRPGSHDWNNLLRWTGLLEWDHAIAMAAHLLGSALLLGTLLWGAFALWRGWRAPDGARGPYPT
ncbi:zinc ribbon domain-containing protein [Thiohalorhabdus denitrificans]|nr:zinc ribbon domain-containing protein [Thiohalorhabdus denitrificans]